MLYNFINPEVPQSTLIENCKQGEDGLDYIVENIAINIFEKIFYGVKSIPPFKVIDSKDNSERLELNAPFIDIIGSLLTSIIYMNI
jgi:hypothetical protein